jgi:hypothetical protein
MKQHNNSCWWQHQSCLSFCFLFSFPLYVLVLTVSVLCAQAGGLDKHLLDSLYDDALQRRGPSGPVPNSYNMGLNMPGGNPFQTPGPGMRPQHMDPFMASSQYAPNSNVQMAMMQQQQAMLMQQQQLQQQQQMMGMAPVSANPFGNPYAGPVGAQYPYGSGLAPEAGVQQPIPGQLALPAPPPAYQNPFGNPGLL